MRAWLFAPIGPRGVLRISKGQDTVENPKAFGELEVHGRAHVIRRRITVLSVVLIVLSVGAIPLILLADPPRRHGFLAYLWSYYTLPRHLHSSCILLPRTTPMIRDFSIKQNYVRLVDFRRTILWRSLTRWIIAKHLRQLSTFQNKL